MKPTITNGILYLSLWPVYRLDLSERDMHVTVETGNADTFPIDLDFKTAGRGQGRLLIDIADKVVVKNLTYADQTIDVDAFRTHNRIDSGALHAQTTGELRIAHAVQHYAFPDEGADVNVLKILVHKKRGYLSVIDFGPGKATLSDTGNHAHIASVVYYLRYKLGTHVSG